MCARAYIYVCMHVYVRVRECVLCMHMYRLAANKK